ncbi:MAG TPA: alpha/beta hydrolase [Cellulomonas sp.]
MSSTLAHDVTGSGGPLLVLVHGITEDRRSWDPLLPALAGWGTVLRVDLRGHGGSAPAGPDGDYLPGTLAADVRAVVEQVAAPGQPTVLIGHSLGGVVVTAYGATYPVSAVVNVDQPLALGALQAQVLELEPLLRSEAFDAVIGQMFQQMYGALDPAETARLDGIRRPSQQVVLGVWSIMLDQSPDELAATVAATAAVPADVPYIAVQGIPTGPDYPGWLRERLPQLRFEDWGEVGHYPHLHEPERFLALVDEVLAEVARG